MTSNYLRNIAYFTISILGVFAGVSPGLTQNVAESSSTIVERVDQNSASEKSDTNLEIISIAHQGDNQTLTSDRSLTVRIKATPRAVASVLLVADKHTITEITAHEISPGVYQATIEFDLNTRIVEGAIMARLQHGKQVIYDVADIPVSVISANSDSTCTLGGSQPSLFHRCNLNSLAPKVAVNSTIPLSFTSHSNGDIINENNLVVMGQTQANAEVRITVNSTVPLIGSFVELEGKTLVNQTINADREGNFSFVIPQESSTMPGLKYTINAIAILEDRASKSVKLTLQQN